MGPRIARDREDIHVGRREAADLEAGPHRAPGHAGTVLDAAVTLFLHGGELPVAHERRRYRRGMR
jgi:hypothetical protein